MTLCDYEQVLGNYTYTEVSIFTWRVLALQQTRIFNNSIQLKWLKLGKSPAIFD